PVRGDRHRLRAARLRSTPLLPARPRGHPGLAAVNSPISAPPQVRGSGSARPKHPLESVMRTRRMIHVAVTAAAAGSLLVACSGAGGSSTSGGDGESINVLMVGNPQMEDIAKLTKDHFT